MNPIENKNRPKLKATTYTPILLDGKLQPQAVELEEAVLGAMMLEKEALSQVIDILKPESFYKPAHQAIYRAIVELFTGSEPVDILTVTTQLKKTGELEIAGGAYGVSQLTNRVASSANIEYHARIVAQKFLQRELIRLSTDTIHKSYEESTDVFDLLDTATKNIFELVDSNVRKQHDKMSSLVADAIKQIEIAGAQTSGVTGVPSGFTALDRITSGWQKSDLVILAARPGMGKTAFVLTIARNASVEFTRPTALFSLEMSSLQLVNRLIAGEAELSQDKIRKGNLEPYEWQQLNSRINALTKAPLYIDDTPALSIFELRAKARRLKENFGIEMIIIDYLQLMTAGSDNKGNREQEISYISRSLKGLAKELNVPIIALSQLSRSVETRASGSKRPMLSDLRESGAIEQDADMVLFIYRPEYYGLTEDENGNSTKGKAEVIIAKNRNGSLEDVPLRFIGQYAKFADLDYQEDTNALYNPSSGLAPSEDFLGTTGPQTKTVASKNWGNDDSTNLGANDIKRGNPNHDIEEPF